jgi:hypothetical protein
MNSQEIDLYVALPDGVYLYEPEPHRLRPVAAGDMRAKTGSQPFVPKPRSTWSTSRIRHGSSTGTPNRRRRSGLRASPPEPSRRTCTCSALRRDWRRCCALRPTRKGGKGAEAASGAARHLRAIGRVSEEVAERHGTAVVTDGRLGKSLLKRNRAGGFYQFSLSFSSQRSVEASISSQVTVRSW